MLQLAGKGVGPNWYLGHYPSLLAARRRARRRYSPYGSAGENGAGAEFTAFAPQSGQASARV